MWLLRETRKAIQEHRKYPALAVLIFIFVLMIFSQIYRVGMHELKYGVHIPEEEKARIKARIKRASELRALYQNTTPTIHRTVSEVEGIYLERIRQRSRTDWDDPLWPDAGLPDERTGEEYIRTFLSTEYAHRDRYDKPEPITPERRGLVGLKLARGVDITPEDRPGYRYVDAPDEQTGEVMRYSLDDVGRLLKVPATPPYPQYSVTFDSPLVLEERAKFPPMAHTTLRVKERQTGEVLGEVTMYAVVNEFLDTPPLEQGKWTGKQWHSAQHYPALGEPFHITGYKTRLFVDRILQPAGW